MEQLSIPRPRRLLPEFPRDAWLLYLGRFMRDAGRGLLAVLAVLHLREIGIGNVQIGVLLAVSLAGGFAMSLLVMLVAHRYSARLLAVAISAVTGIAGVVLVATDQLALLVAAGFFGSYAASGFHWGPMLQIEQSGIANLCAADTRTQAFAALNIASSVGRALGALLAGGATLLNSTFDVEIVDAYRVMLAVYCALTFLGGAAYLMLSSAPDVGTLRAGAGERDGRDARRADAPRIQNPFRARSRRRILSISALMGVDSFAGGMIFESFLSLWLVAQFDVTAAAVGLLLVAAQLANMVSLALAPTVARRIGLLNTLVFTQIASNLALIAFAFAPALWVAVALWLVRSLLDEMDVPTRQSYMMGIVTPEERPVMAGTANLGRGLGRTASPLATGVLWAGALSIAPWLWAAAIKIGYDVAIYFAFRRVEPREERGERTAAAADAPRPPASRSEASAAD